MRVNAEVRLKKERCSDKVYFDKMLKKFTNEMNKTFIMDEIRLKRTFLKPSMLKKIKPQVLRNKWKNYKW